MVRIELTTFGLTVHCSNLSANPFTMRVRELSYTVKGKCYSTRLAAARTDGPCTHPVVLTLGIVLHMNLRSRFEPYS